MIAEERLHDTRGLNVAIVGGGLCGLAVAVGLKRAGVEVDIYEAAPKFGEIGAGVGLGPNAVRVLKELGILDEVLAKVEPEELDVPPIRFLSGFGEHQVIYDYPAIPEDKGLGIHRATFLDALAPFVDAAKTHFNKRCIGLRTVTSDSEHGMMQIDFADGTRAEADVVLGADGIRSSVRAFVATADSANAESGAQGGGGVEDGDPASVGLVEPVFTNTNAYRGLVPAEQLRNLGMKTDLSRRPHCFTGIGKHIITFPIKGGTVINVVAFACDRTIAWGARPLPAGQSWVTPRTTAELLAEYAGWGTDVTLLLGCLAQPSVWAIHAVDPPLTTYVSGRAALLGDAAHGMLPHLGAGAGQALEDALVLVRLLAHPGTRADNVEAVLEAYDVVRRPRANMILAASTKTGDIYEGFGPSGDSVRGIREDLEGKWDKVWHHDLQADIDAAVRWLVEKGVF